MPFYRAAHQGGMAWAAWLRPGSTDILDDLAKIPGNSYIQIGDEPGEEYFMVVNMKHGANLDKIAGLRTIHLTFDKSVEKIERLNRLTGKVEILKTVPVSSTTNRVTVRLEGGTGDLFKWSNGIPWALR
jgi:hypothetical protein